MLTYANLERLGLLHGQYVFACVCEHACVSQQPQAICLARCRQLKVVYLHPDSTQLFLFKPNWLFFSFFSNWSTSFSACGIHAPPPLCQTIAHLWPFCHLLLFFYDSPSCSHRSSVREVCVVTGLFGRSPGSAVVVLLMVSRLWPGLV